MLKVVRAFSLCSISIIALSSCAANDINIKSKNGDSISVPVNSIKVTSFDKQAAIISYDKWISRIDKGLTECLKDFPNQKMCKDVYNKAIRGKKDERNLISDMPDISIVQYSANIKTSNGDTKNVNKSYVACLPNSVSSEQEKWKEIIYSVNSLNESPMETIKFNRGENKESINSILCQEYSSTI